MRCDRSRALMDKYAAEELAPDERAALNLHLRDCPGCRQQWVRWRGLLRILRSVPAPPVPQEFVGRVMARARQGMDRQQPSREVGPEPASWWGHGGMPQLVNMAAAVAAGLLLGLVLGRQTWQFSTRPIATDRSAENARVTDVETVYSLDYLSGNPRGSFTKTYLSLTRVAGDQEF
jgi:anti-sigma factor RsiW